MTQTGTDNRKETNLNIPVQVLPNEYALELSNLSVKRVVSDVGQTHFDYVTLKCKVNYSLNGKKAGKRRIIFVSFDASGGVLELIGEHKEYRFSELGFEFVDICFDHSEISGISVYVKEM